MLYSGLYWFSVRLSDTGEKKVFFASSVFVFACLIMLMWWDLFFGLFGAVLLISFIAYVGSHKKISNGKYIIFGAIGGLWLSIPLYSYLAGSV